MFDRFDETEYYKQNETSSDFTNQYNSTMIGWYIMLVTKKNFMAASIIVVFEKSIMKETDYTPGKKLHLKYFAN